MIFDKNFRLPKTVLPRRYDLRLDVDLENWKYGAIEAIEVDVKEPVQSIALHAIGFDIQKVEIETGGKRLKVKIDWKKEADVVLLVADEEIPIGSATIHLEFTGVILERLRGFYRSTKDGKRFATTQFEAADARRAFPCFDEPEFKARYRLTLVVPENAETIANGAIEKITALENGRKEVRFTETPPISSYLVAFCIGPFKATPIVQTKSNIPVRVFLPSGMEEKGIYARDAHVKALTYLENYTQITYPYGKVDAIGVPDFEAGAMENPGAITYRMTEIAADPKTASANTLKSIFYTAAHELTHMWWGDLVTMKWWNDLWLNESFATFIGYKVVASEVPEWDIWRDFVANLERPFALDSLVSTHPISFEVKNAAEASERFDVIVYWKGAGVVRMIEHYLGAEVFQKGVQLYLNKFRESNAEADNFWAELSEVSGQDVGKLANIWLRQGGHPVVEFNAEKASDGLKLVIKQSRFLADPGVATDETIWPVPIVIKFGSGEVVQETRILLEGKEAEVELAGAEWFFPNGEASGFYRVLLDDVSAAMLEAQAESKLKPHERLYYVDNQWSLLRAGKIGVENFLATVKAFKSEKDRAVISAIADHLSWLGNHVVTPGARPKFEMFVRDYYDHHFKELGWEPLSDEPLDVRLTRSVVLGALGGVARDPEIRSEARKRFDAHHSNTVKLDPNILSLVTHLSAREGDAEFFDELLEHKKKSTNDPEKESRFLGALASFEHPKLTARALSMALTEEVRTQDRTLFLGRMLGYRMSRDAAWNNVRSHWDEIRQSLDPMMMQRLVQYLGQLTHEPVASEVRKFLNEKATDGLHETIAQTDERLKIDSATVTLLSAALEELFEE